MTKPFNVICLKIQIYLSNVCHTKINTKRIITITKYDNGVYYKNLKTRKRNINDNIKIGTKVKCNSRRHQRKRCNLNRLAACKLLDNIVTHGDTRDVLFMRWG